MALVLIPSPSDTPATTADWYKVNGVLQSIGLGIGGGTRVLGSIVPRGAVLFFAGAWYVADSDTVITGTASQYVKVTNTAGVVAPSFVANITGVTWSKTWQGWYDADGNMYLFDEVEAYGKGVISDLYSVVNSRVSQEMAAVIANISTNYKRLLRPASKTILTVGSGTYTVPDGVYNIEVFLQGPGGDGAMGGVGGPPGISGQGGATSHELIDVTPGQTISWVVSTTTTTFGAYAIAKGTGAFGLQGYGSAGGGEGGGIWTVRSPVANSGGGGAGSDSYPIPGQLGATGRIEIW